VWRKRRDGRASQPFHWCSHRFEFRRTVSRHRSRLVIPDDTPYFYWLISESRERAALGLIGEDGQEKTRKCLEQFMKSVVHADRLSGRAIPVYDHWTPVERRVGAGRVFFGGRCGRTGEGRTVGGIVAGFRGALGVSEAILNNGESRELRSLRRELDLHLLIRKTIHQFQAGGLQSTSRSDECSNAGGA